MSKFLSALHHLTTNSYCFNCIREWLRISLQIHILSSSKSLFPDSAVSSWWISPSLSVISARVLNFSVLEVFCWFFSLHDQLAKQNDCCSHWENRSMLIFIPFFLLIDTTFQSLLFSAFSLLSITFRTQFWVSTYISDIIVVSSYIQQ